MDNENETAYTKCIQSIQNANHIRRRKETKRNENETKKRKCFHNFIFIKWYIRTAVAVTATVNAIHIKSIYGVIKLTANEYHLMENWMR